MSAKADTDLFRSVSSRRDGGVDDLLGLGKDAAQMFLALETFAVDFVDLLGAGRTRGEPSAGGNHFQPADRSAVSRRLRENLLDRLGTTLY